MKTMLAFALTLSAVLNPAAGAAAPGAPRFEQRCEREMKPLFSVSLRESGYRIDNTVPSRVLNMRGAHNYAGDLMLGMTALQARTEVIIDAPSLSDQASGRECIAPRVAVDLIFPRMSVFVAREFAPNSCSYREVLEHEMRHVQLYRDQFPAVEERVRRELAARFGDRPLYAAHGKGLAALEAQVDTWLRPFIKAEIASMELAQANIDTFDESFRLSSSCLGELANHLSRGY